MWEGGGSRMPTYRLGPPTAVQLGEGGGRPFFAFGGIYIQDNSATQQKKVSQVSSERQWDHRFSQQYTLGINRYTYVPSNRIKWQRRIDVDVRCSISIDRSEMLVHCCWQANPDAEIDSGHSYILTSLTAPRYKQCYKTHSLVVSIDILFFKLTNLTIFPCWRSDCKHQCCGAGFLSFWEAEADPDPHPSENPDPDLDPHQTQARITVEI